MNIAVFFGGESCEHDISIITGEQFIFNSNKYLYNIIPIYIDKDGNWLTGKGIDDIDNLKIAIKKAKKCTLLPNDSYLYIKKNKAYKKSVIIDVAVLCLHGLRGEDGSVAGLLELSKIPYTSSSLCASSVCLDKCIFKSVIKGLGINTVSSVVIEEWQFLQDTEKVYDLIGQLGYPVIVKPSRQGSSIGIEVCWEEKDLRDSLKKAFYYDKKLLIEKFLNVKKEVNVAVFSNKGEFVVSNTEEPVSKDKILSFEDKYLKNSGGFETIKRVMPANITVEQEREIKEIAKNVYLSLEMFGVVRFDFLIGDDDMVYLNEVNTIPGSMANYLFDKNTYSYQKLIDILVSNAIYRKSIEDGLKRVYETEVLKNGLDGFKK